jgi:hypothetical protein
MGLSIGFMLALSSCVVDDTRGVTAQLLSVRWVKPDSVLAYSTLTQSWESHYGEVRYTESTFRIFLIRSGDSGLTGKQALYEAHAIIPCSDMRYKDSLLFFSYHVLTDTNGRYVGSPCGSTGHADSVVGGRLHNNHWLNIQDDTASQAKILEAIREYPATSPLYSRDSGITDNGAFGPTLLFCVNGSCFGP